MVPFRSAVTLVTNKTDSSDTDDPPRTLVNDMLNNLIFIISGIMLTPTEISRVLETVCPVTTVTFHSRKSLSVLHVKARSSPRHTDDGEF